MMNIGMLCIFIFCALYFHVQRQQQQNLGQRGAVIASGESIASLQRNDTLFVSLRGGSPPRCVPGARKELEDLGR